MTNFIIRHLRVRPTDLSGDQGDAIRLANNSNFILDHVTTSWGSDETVDLYQSHDFTIQWSTIEASAPLASHPDGAYHNYGLINGPNGHSASIHHNLFAHHSHRTPAITTHTCLEAYELVLAQAGAWPRDGVTLQTIEEVENGTGAWGRIVPADLMAGLTPTSPPADGDGDGMPDDWERARGLNPTTADDADADGYTNIEEYLHYRSDLLIHGDSPDASDTSAPTPPDGLTVQSVSASQIDLAAVSCDQCMSLRTPSFFSRLLFRRRQARTNPGVST